MFYFINIKPIKLTIAIVVWGILHSILAFNGFYQMTPKMPPKIFLVFVPAILLVFYGFRANQRIWIIKKRKIELSIFLHSIPVEILLFYLFSNKMVPDLLTFEGRNFHVLAGITAPIVGYLWIKKSIGRNVIIIWNFLALFLILFVLINGILSSEMPVQMFGVEQPNRAVNYVPFILLPATIVPILIYTHIIDLIKLYSEKRTIAL